MRTKVQKIAVTTNDTIRSGGQGSGDHMVVVRVTAYRFDDGEVGEDGHTGGQVRDVMGNVVVRLTVPLAELGPVAQAAVRLGEDLIEDVHLEAPIQPRLYE